MCTKVLGLPEYFILDMFIFRLKDNIQIEVLKGKPLNIQEAYDLTLLIENQQPNKDTWPTYNAKFNKQTPSSASTALVSFVLRKIPLWVRKAQTLFSSDWHPRREKNKLLKGFASIVMTNSLWVINAKIDFLGCWLMNFVYGRLMKWMRLMK